MSAQSQVDIVCVCSLEDGGSSIRDVHERQPCCQAGEQNGGKRKTVLCAPRQELGSLTAQGQPVENTGGREQEGVSGREGGSQDASVDDVREHLDAGASHDDNVGGLSGSARVLQEIGVIVGHDHASDKYTKDLRENGESMNASRHCRGTDIEDQDTPEDTSHSLGNVAARVLGLRSGTLVTPQHQWYATLKQ